jgi:hypothetical protein
LLVRVEGLALRQAAIGQLCKRTKTSDQKKKPRIGGASLKLELWGAAKCWIRTSFSGEIELK